MWNSKLIIALAASLLLAGPAAAAEEEQDWPPFNEVDTDGDGLISPTEAQLHEGLEDEIDEEEGFMRRQQYEDLRAEHSESNTGYPGPGMTEDTGAGTNGGATGTGDTGTGGDTGTDAGGDTGSDSD